MNRFAALLAAAVVAIAAPPARAQEDMPPPMPEGQFYGRPHGGLFLQLDAAIGYMSTSSSAGGVDVSAAGFAGEFGAAAGVRLDDLVLAGQFWILGSGSPTVTAGGVSSYNSGAAVYLSGVGFTFLFHFSDGWYMSATPSITRLSVAYNGQTESSDQGFGARFAIGNASYLGRGPVTASLALYLYLSSNTTSGPYSPTWGTAGIALGGTFGIN